MRRSKVVASCSIPVTKSFVNRDRLSFWVSLIYINVDTCSVTILSSIIVSITVHKKPPKRYMQVQSTLLTLIFIRYFNEIYSQESRSLIIVLLVFISILFGFVSTIL